VVRGFGRALMRLGIDKLPYYGTYARLDMPLSANAAEVEAKARTRLRSGHDTPDALKFYAIMQRWHEHRQAGRIL
jgi:hypothetical protein